MTILDNLTVTQAPSPNPEEELAEAKAWGFKTVAEFYDAVLAAYKEAENE